MFILEIDYNVINNFIFYFPLLLFSLSDLIIRYKYNKIIPKHPQSCYYLIHTLFNTYISFQTFNSVIYSLNEPDNFYLEDHTHVGSLIGMFHIYHTINYLRYLQFDDIMHHIMSWIVCYYGVEYKFGGGANIIAFFMCGLPGIFYYGPLFLTLNGNISRSLQKKINLYANFIRCIGIIYGVSILNFCYANGRLPLTNPLFNAFLSLLCFWNATYFFYIVIIDYAKYL